jgi:hypothetical protein
MVLILSPEKLLEAKSILADNGETDVIELGVLVAGEGVVMKVALS